MKSLKIVILCSIFFFILACPIAAHAFDPQKDILLPHAYPNLKELISFSDIIGYGNINGVERQFSTPVSVARGKLVNTLQRFEIKQAFKGVKHSIHLMITGVEPLPKPSDPLNQIYPGPLATGEYVLFLKKLEGTNDYQLSGGWQGVYPILNGKSVALYGIGFKDLDELTVNDLFRKLHQH